MCEKFINNKIIIFIFIIFFDSHMFVVMFKKM